MRAGLRALFGDSADMTVIGDASRIEALTPILHDADVLVLTAEEELLADFQHLLWDIKPYLAILLLTGDMRRAMVMSDMQFRSWGVLSPDSTKEELLSAVRALHQGLLVVAPEAMKNLMSPSSLSGGDEGIPFEQLTARETEVLQCISQGQSNKQIAAILNISEHTVKFHISSIYAKLEVANRTEAAHKGLRYGLIAL